MSDFRARDADRDGAVELIETAFVDGQIGGADRDLRVGRALSAETLDELESLTRDLQRPAAMPGTGPPVSPRPVPGPQRRLVGVLVALAAVVGLLVVGVASLVLFATAEPDSATSTEVSSGSAPAEPELVVQDPAASFAMNPAQVRKVLRSYLAKFGTLDAFEMVLYPERVGVQVPVRGSRPRSERWSYDGRWRQDSEASRVIGTDGTADLGAIDVGRLFDNIAVAKRVLRVEDGRLTHVLVQRGFDDLPAVHIYVSNRFNESGYLRTTPSGVEIRRYPYES